MSAPASLATSGLEARHPTSSAVEAAARPESQNAQTKRMKELCDQAGDVKLRLV